MVVSLAQTSSPIFGNGNKLDKKKSRLKSRLYFEIEILRRTIYIWREQTRVKWDRAELFLSRGNMYPRELYLARNENDNRAFQSGIHCNS